MQEKIRTIKEHYEIELNNNPVKIYRYSDKYYFNPDTGKKDIHRLHLETTIDEQNFNQWNQTNHWKNYTDTTYIKMYSKSRLWLKEYVCEYIGGEFRITPYYEKFTYLIKNKKLFRKEGETYILIEDGN